MRRAFDLYPKALVEDPPETIAGMRVSWDMSIRSAADLRGLRAAPQAVNVKPARLGSVRALFELYRECAARGIAVYGGGQHELARGRAQIQLLAALHHADAPNDVAPTGYNDYEPSGSLPPSPLVLTERPGFG